jgi:[ribosomal protein S5]-alanine N-acetyltransferase
MPQEIATARLVLRRQRVDDAVPYRELWTERDPRVPPHRRIGPDGRPTVEDIAAQIDTELHSPKVGLLTVTRSVDGDVIGYCGLLFDGQSMPGEPELAYELLRRAHGYGFATEAARAVVAWAADAGVERLWAGVRAWNLASRNVLHKLGFVETGRVVPDTHFGDSVITCKSLLEPGSSSASPGDG